MEIKFEINEAQASALKELLPLSGKVQNPDELAKIVFVTFIIQNTQQLIAERLKIQTE